MSQKEEGKGKDDLHLWIDADVLSNFNHACINENVKIRSHAVEGLMMLFNSEHDIRKRVKEEITMIARREGRKRILKNRSDRKKET